MIPTPESEGRGWGKVILLGEHGVVYGGPALAVGLSQGARAVATQAGVHSSSPSLLRVGSTRIYSTGRGDLARAYAALLKELGLPPMRVKAVSTLPAGGGLGSSAALGVAIARAVAGLKPEPSLEAIAKASHAWECIFHGNPSGIDTTAALRGGCFRFVRGQGATSIQLGRPLQLAIGFSGKSGSTRSMVSMVAKQREEEPERVREAFDALTELVTEAIPALETGAFEGLGAAFVRAHEILSGLHLSTPTLDWLCSSARDSGALGAKLTGSGGGGSVVALLPSEPSEGAAVGAKVLEAWSRKGVSGFVTQVSAQSADAMETADAH